MTNHISDFKLCIIEEKMMFKKNSRCINARRATCTARVLPKNKNIIVGR